MLKRQVFLNSYKMGKLYHPMTHSTSITGGIYVTKLLVQMNNSDQVEESEDC